MKKTRIGVLGASGRMGTLVARLLETELSDRTELAASAARGESLEPLLAPGVDVVIDFSLPEAMSQLAKMALQPRPQVPAFVVGSTGWRIEDRRALDELAKKTLVLMSSNFSVGVLALLQILREASPLLEKLGYTPVVVETHHRHKKDAPSGTAISLQRAIAPAGPGNVQTVSVRAGEIVGDHEVTFYGAGDHLTLGHFAQDRSIFARGAIEAALWLAEKRAAGQNPGSILSMETFFKERYL